MSFDLGVWYPHKRLSNDEAAELYVHLSAGDTTGVMPHLAIGSFYADLIAKHPEIDSVPDERIDNQDFCPWSSSLERSPGHIIIFCVWSKAEHVHQLVHGLALKHGLAVYDPQSDSAAYPDGIATRKAWWKIW